MGVPGVLYSPTPRGYNGNPAWAWAQAVSVYVRRLLGPADWWVPPATDPTAWGVLSGTGYCRLASDDEGFVEVSMDTVPPPCGRSL